MEQCKELAQILINDMGLNIALSYAKRKAAMRGGPLSKEYDAAYDVLCDISEKENQQNEGED